MRDPSQLTAEDILREFIFKPELGEPRLFIRKRNGERAGWIEPDTNGDPRVRIRISGKKYRQYNLIWNLMIGEIPKDHTVHHKDFDTCNDRLGNLDVRDAKGQNQDTRGKKGRALPKNIYIVKDRYAVRIMADRQLHIKYFKTLEKALEHRNHMIKKMHGSNANLGY